MTFSVTLAVVLVLHEHVFVAAVYRKCHRRDTQSREGALESVPPTEETRVSPFVTVLCSQSSVVSPRRGCGSVLVGTDYRSHGS